MPPIIHLTRNEGTLPNVKQIPGMELVKYIEKNCVKVKHVCKATRN